MRRQRNARPRSWLHRFEARAPREGVEALLPTGMNANRPAAPAYCGRRHNEPESRDPPPRPIFWPVQVTMSGFQLRRAPGCPEDQSEERQPGEADHHAESESGRPVDEDDHVATGGHEYSSKR